MDLSDNEYVVLDKGHELITATVGSGRVGEVRAFELGDEDWEEIGYEAVSQDEPEVFVAAVERLDVLMGDEGWTSILDNLRPHASELVAEVIAYFREKTVQLLTSEGHGYVSSWTSFLEAGRNEHGVFLKTYKLADGPPFVFCRRCDGITTAAELLSAIKEVTRAAEMEDLAHDNLRPIIEKLSDVDADLANETGRGLREQGWCSFEDWPD